VIDALPVRLFCLRDEGVFARTVALDNRDCFAWRDVHADPAFAAQVERVLGTQAIELPRPYCSEICTTLTPWVAAVTGKLERGLALFIDYGHARADYYAPSRRDGTLRCHYRHRAHGDPLILPGLQDITAWVDFDALHEAGLAAGFVLEASSSQAHFLMAHGVEEVFACAYANARDESMRYRLAQEIKRLTLPGEMGDAFRVMCLRKS
jgi:SAM-dependent MidA family methyltransferase